LTTTGDADRREGTWWRVQLRAPSRLPAELVELVYLAFRRSTRVSATGVPDTDYQAARAEFSEKELVDLTIAISLMNAYNRMAISFRNTPQAAVA
jgi:hypothetical protein